jgi:hypothetical protein
MPQEIIGTPVPKVDTGDKNQAMPKPSPADRDRNRAVPKPNSGLPFGIRKRDMSPVGPMISDKSE